MPTVSISGRSSWTSGPISQAIISVDPTEVFLLALWGDRHVPEPTIRLGGIERRATVVEESEATAGGISLHYFAPRDDFFSDIVVTNAVIGSYWLASWVALADVLIREEDLASWEIGADNTTALPEISAYTAPEDGLGISFMLIGKPGITSTHTEPAALTDLMTATSVGLVEAQMCSYPLSSGVNGAETWTGDDATTHAFIVAGTFPPSLRVPYATAYAGGSRVSTDTGGSYPPPLDVTPFQPEVNPLPPEPSEIEVPLPPWVPGTGPYRKSDVP